MKRAEQSRAEQSTFMRTPETVRSSFIRSKLVETFVYVKDPIFYLYEGHLKKGYRRPYPHSYTVIVS